MTTIYLDAGALMVAGGTAASGTRSPSTDAVRMVSHLQAFGHKTVLLGDRETLEAAGASLPAKVMEVESLSAVDQDAEGWLLTDSADLCTAARSHRRLKTVLVGGPSTSHDLAHRPADRMARSLSDAVLDILATEAMPEPASGHRSPANAVPDEDAMLAVPEVGLGATTTTN